VFACHSYGCYVFAVYCQLFNTDRIIGIIDVGGAPIRFYPAIHNQVANVDHMSLQQILDNLDDVYSRVLEISKKSGTNALGKYAMLGLARSIVSGVGFRDMF
jgi:predicted alpha/beta hydrolase family esterase